MNRIIILIAVLATSILYPSLANIIMADEAVKGMPTEATILRSTPIMKLPNTAPKILVWLTAYSSSPEETDSTPFITASGKRVRDGIVATNSLPFGTYIQIPSLFGNKVFVVEDRMHPRKEGVVDIWMNSKEEALKFGAHKAEILVLN